VPRVEVRRTAVEVGFPGVEDGAERSGVGGVGTKLVAAFGVGAHIDGVRPGVAEVELETVGGGMP